MIVILIKVNCDNDNTAITTITTTLLLLYYYCFYYHYYYYYQCLNCITGAGQLLKRGVRWSNFYKIC